MSESLTVRESIPLVLLYESEDYRIEGRTRFQKMVFLVQETLQDEDFNLYKFIKYDYGPFAKELLDDLERFEELKLVKIEEQRLYKGGNRYDHKLTPKGFKSIRNLLKNNSNPALEAVQNAAQDVIKRWNDESMWDLLDHIYEENPEYKEHSVLY